MTGRFVHDVGDGFIIIVDEKKYKNIVWASKFENCLMERSFWALVRFLHT